MTESQEIIADSSPQASDQWMVRTAQNLIHGPYSKDEICDFIEVGKLTTLDEVCPAAGYWFFLHETYEVQKQLGVNPPLPVHNADDEVTETEVRTQSLTSLAESEEEAKREFEQMADSNGTMVIGAPVHPDGSSTFSGAPPGRERDQAAAEAVQRAFLRTQEREESESNDWIKKFENLSFWKTLTIFLVVLTAALFISIVRLIRD